MPAVGNDRLSARIRAALRSKILGHASWMISGGVLQAVIAFGGNLVLVRLLLPEDFGRFALIVANVGLIQSIICFRIATQVIRIPEEDLADDRLAVYWTGQLIETIAAGSGAVLFLWAVDLLGLEGWILLATTLATPWVGIQVALYERQFDYKRLSMIETGSLALSHVLAVVGALAGLGALVLYLRAAVSLAVIMLGLVWLRALRRVRLRWPDAAARRKLLLAVRGLWAEGLLEQTYHRLVILAVGYMGSEREAGYYVQAQRLAILPHQLLQPLLHRIAYNYFSNKVAPEDALKVLSRVLRNAGAALVACALVAVLVADPVIPWLYGAGWDRVASLLVPLVGTIAAFPLMAAMKVYALARHRIGRFMLWGRTVQYVALGCAVAASHWLGYDVAFTVAAGASTGYVLGTLLPYLRERVQVARDSQQSG